MKLEYCEAMDSMTDRITSGSELEEGEIEDADNSEVEIISEVFKGPGIGFINMGVVAAVKKRSGIEGEITDIKSKRRKPSYESATAIPIKHQEPVLPSHKLQRPVNNNRRSPKYYQSRNQNKSIGMSRRPAELRRKETSRSPSQNQGTGQINCFDSSTPILAKTEEKKEVKDGGKSPNLKNVDSDDDEMELKLRLAALESVVMKAVRNEEALDKSPGTQIDNKSEKVDSEDDEDEELLRAQLLIEVAKKQTMEMEPQTRIETLSTTNSVGDSSRQPTVTSGPILKIPTLRKFNQSVPVQLTERLIIDLRDDSSDSSEDEQNVDDSITALIKSARLSADQKSNAVASAVSTLPLHEQEEYRRLKSELERRANKSSSSAVVQKLQDGSRKVVSNTVTTAVFQKLQNGSPTLATIPQKPLQLSQAAIAKESTVIVENFQEEPPKIAALAVTKTTDDKLQGITYSSEGTTKSMPVTNECSTTESHEDAPGKESDAGEVPSEDEKPSGAVEVKDVLTTKTAPASKALPKPPVKLDASDKLKTTTENLQATKVAALKQQLVQKKNATKDALKSQLELVDKNRALLERSSQEVIRLKALLQTAEEAERQFRLQLNTSQSKLQNLNKKMLLIEKEIGKLHSGASPSRAKRLNQKLRAKAVHTAMSVINHSPSHFRVKPTVLAKALTNKAIAHSHQSTTVIRSANVLDLSKVLTRTQENSEKNKGKYDGWLYGTLGDDAKESTESSFPTWTSNEHASKTVGKPPMNPWNAICLNSLNGICQRTNCSFQHLTREVIAVEATKDPNVLHSTSVQDLA